jgi:formimidoylglutamate deiminase
MADYFTHLALLPEGWARDVRIGVDGKGFITSVVGGGRPQGATVLDGPVLPGMPNLHSHAFQYALAGRLERGAGGDASFWTWRDGMYAFVDALDPDAIEAISAQAFVAMLEAGYTAVGEFHYVHHASGGKRYPKHTEMADRVMRAARIAGIGITLLPVFYESSDFGGKTPEPTQLRFVTSIDEFVALWEEIAAKYGSDSNVALGAAPHSLRAVTLASLNRLQEQIGARHKSAPLHIHVSEQRKEVDDCLARLKKTPVATLLSVADKGLRWTLVHATHATPEDVDAIAAAKAVVALCPTAEANLGDGLFPAPRFLNRGGWFGIGSDSHVTLDVAEELRLLEYGQRLVERHRTVFASADIPSCGEFLYRSAASAGAFSLGRQIGSLARGYRADLVVLDPAAPCLQLRDRTQLLDGFVFTGSRVAIRDVFVGGERVVENHRHVCRDEIAERYREALTRFASHAAV